MSINVVRAVPNNLLQGLSSGHYTLHGGVVRHAAGMPKAGSIVGHLSFGSEDAIRQLGNSFTPLLQATAALSALNLAVSVVGFVVVCRKLNAIKVELDAVAQKLEILMKGQAHIQWQMEMERRANWRANLENLAIGLSISSRELVAIALARLNESEKFYMSFLDDLMPEMQGIYENPEPVRLSFVMTGAAAMARVHALSLMGHPREALMVLEQYSTWHDSLRKKLEAPLVELPTWLGKLDATQRGYCKELIQAQRVVPEAIAYTRQNLEYCIENGISPDEFAQLTQDHPVVYLPA